MPNYRSASTCSQTFWQAKLLRVTDPRLYVSSVTIKSGTLRTLEERESGIS